MSDSLNPQSDRVEDLEQLLLEKKREETKYGASLNEGEE